MGDFPLPLNETERLAALRSFDVLDSAPEQAFDDIARLASSICEAPIALVTLIDETRQWFKARVGLEAESTPREHAFCAHAIAQVGTFVVPDALEDSRFATNPLVTGEPRIRFYMGTPLLTSGGHGLGTLCVIDTRPRSLTPLQVNGLETLGRIAVGQLELRRTTAELGSALRRVRILSGLLPICSYCKAVRDDDDYWKSVESYMRDHSPVDFTHGICPGCFAKHFPDLPLDEVEGSG